MFDERRIALLSAALSAALLMGCPKPGETGAQPKETLWVFVDEDPNDPNNLKKVRLGAVTVGEDGRLALELEKDLPPASDKLKKAIASLQARGALKMRVDSKENTPHGPAMVMRMVEVPPGDPRFIYAAAAVLKSEFGFDARAKK